MRVITDINEVPAVEDDWRELAVHRGNAFMTPEWHGSWLATQEGELSPFVVVLSQEGSPLEAVLPLVLEGNGRGVLRTAGGELGDTYELLTRGAETDEIDDALARALGAANGAWSSLVLRNTSPTATWPARIAQARRGLTVAHGASQELPYINLRGLDWAGYLATKSRNFRSQVGAARRRLEREHDLGFRVTSDEQDLERDLETFFRLHAMRHVDATRLTEPWAQSFHRHFARRALERGWLRLSFLSIDAEPVAALYGWRLGSRYSYYNAGFDPAWARSKVGFVLLCETIRAALEEGAQEYDLLLGDEPYKSRFATEARDAQTVVIAPRLSRRRAMYVARRAAQRVGGALPGDTRERLRRRFRLMDGGRITDRTGFLARCSA